MSFGLVKPTIPAARRSLQQFPTVLRAGSAQEFVRGVVEVDTTIHAAEFSDAEEISRVGTEHTLYYPMTKWKDEVRMRVKIVDPVTADVCYKWMVVFREKSDKLHTRHVKFYA